MIDLNTLSHEEVAKLWYQAKGELVTFANHLEPNASPTADQIRLAVQMAERYFQMSKTVFLSMSPTVMASAESPDLYGGLIFNREDRAVSIDQIKNLVATVQKIYQIFTTIMAAIEPLLDPKPQPQPVPPDPGGPGGFITGVPSGQPQ